MYIGLAAILLHVVIMSVSIFKTVVILYICISIIKCGYEKSQFTSM